MATVVPDPQQVGARILCLQQLFRPLWESPTSIGALEVGLQVATKGRSLADENGLHQGSGLAWPKQVIENTAACIAAPQPMRPPAKPGKSLYLGSPRRPREPHAFRCQISREIERSRIAVIPRRPQLCREVQPFAVGVDTADAAPASRPSSSSARWLKIVSRMPTGADKTRSPVESCSASTSTNSYLPL
jgi:hypothetical protein